MIQPLSPWRTSSTSSLISAKLRHHAQSPLGASDILPFSLSLSIYIYRNSTFTEIFIRFWNLFHCSFIPKIYSFYWSTRKISSPSAINGVEFPYPSIDENSRPPTHEPCTDWLILNLQTINHPRLFLRYQIVPVNRTNKSGN